MSVWFTQDQLRTGLLVFMRVLNVGNLALAGIFSVAIIWCDIAYKAKLDGW